MIRGIERGQIFRDDTDRWNLVDRLARYVPLWGGTCFAWVLMGNHVHLVLQTGALPLAWLMRRVNTGFAVRFNRRHERVGYLFQNRFKSRIVERDDDLLNLIRYVHSNPIRSGDVPNLAALERFPWSGHAGLIGTRPPFAFESVGRTLELFDATPSRARRLLRSWMALSSEAPEWPIHDDAGIEERTRVFVDLAHEPVSTSVERSVDELVDSVCRHFSVSRGALACGARDHRVARARSVIAFLLVTRRGLPISEVALRLGVSRQAVGKALERGAEVARTEEPHPRGWS